MEMIACLSNIMAVREKSWSREDSKEVWLSGGDEGAEQSDEDDDDSLPCYLFHLQAAFLDPVVTTSSHFKDKHFLN